MSLGRHAIVTLTLCLLVDPTVNYVGKIGNLDDWLHEAEGCEACLQTNAFRMAESRGVGPTSLYLRFSPTDLSKGHGWTLELQRLLRSAIIPGLHLMCGA